MRREFADLDRAALVPAIYVLRNLSRTPAMLFGTAAIAAGSSEMDKLWEKMTPDEKCDHLRWRLEVLAVEMANDQRKLNDRIVQLEMQQRAG